MCAPAGAGTRAWRARRARHRPEAGLFEELARRGGRDFQPEASQFASDPLVAPERVPAGEEQHQLTNLAADPRPTRSTWVGSAFRRQPGMPAKERRRGDQNRPPARPRQQPAGSGEEDSIDWLSFGRLL